MRRGGDVSKLPKWAKDELVRLEGEVDRLKKAVSVYEATQGESNTHFCVSGKTYALPPGARVRFTSGEGFPKSDPFWAEIHVAGPPRSGSAKEGAIYVNTIYPCFIEPHTSNSFSIRELPS